MLQTLRQLYDQGWHGEAIERARAAFNASPLVREIARNREAARDALAWFGWGLAGSVVLFASWELGGFGVLVGEEPHQEPPGPPAVRQPARTAPAEAQAEGCTQASLNRATGTTTAANCQQALRSQ